MKKLFYLLAIFVTIFSIYNFILPANLETKSGIFFSISSSKKDYIIGEPIWIENIFFADRSVKLTSTPVISPGYDARLIITNSLQDTLKYVGGRLTVINSKYDYDTLYGLRNLLFDYGLPEKFPDSKLLNILYIPADTYTIEVNLKINVDDSLQIVKSNKIQITVADAKGEDFFAYTTWLQILDNFLHQKDFPKLENDIDAFSNQYPNSRYLDRVRYMLLAYSFILPNQKEYIRGLCIDELNRNPNNYFIQRHLNFLKEVYNPNEFADLLKQYSKKFKNSVLDKTIKKHFSK